MTRAAALAVGAIVVAPMIGPVPAATAAPVPRDDAYTVIAGSEIKLPVLDNDTTVGGSGTLTVCDVTMSSSNSQVFYATALDTSVYVDIRPYTRGTVSFTYRACQGSEQSRATRVTLSITQLARVQVTKRSDARGQVIARNPNDIGLAVRWGSTKSGRSDGVVNVPANGQVFIRTKRTSIFWVAYRRYGNNVVQVGSGDIYNIAQK